MNVKEKLLYLIENPQKLNIYDWVYEVETFLHTERKSTKEVSTLIDHVKRFGNDFHECDRLVAWLRQLYKKDYDQVVLPEITKRNQIFVAMMFSAETDITYTEVYKPIISDLNYSAMRIDEKEFNGSIIDEIKSEISDSVALIADLTGNRGGVYYEAGIAKGLQMCNHPIKLILTCNKEFFDKNGVHFDVKGDNFILYDNNDDLKTKLAKRLNTVLHGVNNDKT